MVEHFPALRTPDDCRHLSEVLGGGHLTLWATTLPRPTVDVLLGFRAELKRRGKRAVLLLYSNALERFCSLCSPENRADTYLLDNMDLLQYCNFIEVLFTHDHCIWRKPENFSKKLVLFKHNLATTALTTTDVYADYVVTINANTPPFNFSRYPNHRKFTYGKTCTLVPGGYPKLDLLIRRRREYGAGPFNRVAFFPVSLPFTVGQHGQELYLEAWSELIEGFLCAFPGREFILRPYPPDREAAVFSALRERFAAQPFFYMDMADDNIRYLLSSDLLITDYSSVCLNFSYATLRPVIWLRPTAPTFRAGSHEDLGIMTCSAAQALEAVAHALASLPQWEARIRRKRDLDVSHAGETLDYLADHVDNILKDSPEAEWRVLDKGDTPFDRPADYIRYYVPGRGNAWNRGENRWDIPSPLDWCIEQHGWNPRIALAALRAYVLAWDHLLLVRRAEIYPQIRLALDMARPEHSLAFLNHRVKKAPHDAAAVVLLAVVLAHRKAEHARIRALLESAAPDLDPVLAGVAAPLWHQEFGECAKARGLLHRASKYCEYLVPEARLLYLLLLAGDSDLTHMKNFLDGWRHYEIPENVSVEYAFCSSLLHTAREGGEFPLVQETGRIEFFLSGIRMSFRNRRHARACLSPFLALLLRQTEIRPQLWETCSRAQAACGEYKAACVSGWKAARRSLVGVDFLLWLAELMRRHGDPQSAGKVLDLLRLGVRGS